MEPLCTHLNPAPERRPLVLSPSNHPGGRTTPGSSRNGLRASPRSMLTSMLTSMLLMVLSTPPKAAQNEKTCDAAITNVTGSNSVNVFLGLGISWMIASAHVNQIYCFSPRICSRTLIKYSEISVCSGGGTEHPISVLFERQPATSIYADGRSSDDVITF